MRQRAKLLIEIPEDMDVVILLDKLRELNCRSEVIGTLFPTPIIYNPSNSFKFIDERENKDGINCWTGKKIERANQVPKL
jgi:hypothetical protein